MVLKELCNLEKHRGEQTPDLHLHQMCDRGSSTELGVEGAVGVKNMLATYMYKLFTGEWKVSVLQVESLGLSLG